MLRIRFTAFVMMELTILIAPTIKAEDPRWIPGLVRWSFTPPAQGPDQAGSRLAWSVTSVPPPSRGAHSIDPFSSPRTI